LVSLAAKAKEDAVFPLVVMPFGHAIPIRNSALIGELAIGQFPLNQACGRWDINNHQSDKASR